ncbi:hypothetical protein [Agrilutibacter solisilvae]|uniref:DUF4156 domain-containing protein n=1 Tax=Agrilutibacter solisilvae TaxID=2763317 RepID=A0A975ASB9_9GAMM|nr:hypothetical protein [Lysobacter solisilvae]QSX78128.1 hypothetical protein I8J32_015735 [Lysobacter solisilvae]
MIKCLAIAGMVIATSGCASWSSKPQLCFSDNPPVNPTSAGEIKAVKFVERRVAATCRPTDVECNLQLRHGANDQIEVIASRALVAGDPPACTPLEGGFETYVFSAEGEYIRVVLGL